MSAKMLFDFRFRPPVFFPALSDNIGAATEMLTSTNGDEHLLQDGIAANGMTSFVECFYRNKHRAGIGEVKPVRIAFYNDALHHPVLRMDEGITDGFAKGFVRRRFIYAVNSIQFERNGQNLG